MLSYLEMMSYDTYDERLAYLSQIKNVGDITFGGHRHLNQVLYSSPEWKRFRDRIILRDNSCDLAHPDYEIHSRVYIHHINPLTVDDMLNRSSKIFDPNNVVCVSRMTHDAIHYGAQGRTLGLVERTPNDTCPWK